MSDYVHNVTEVFVAEQCGILILPYLLLMKYVIFLIRKILLGIAITKFGLKITGNSEGSHFHEYIVIYVSICINEYIFAMYVS